MATRAAPAANNTKTTKPKPDAEAKAFVKLAQKNILKALTVLEADPTLANRALGLDPTLLSNWRFANAIVNLDLDPVVVAAALAVFEPSVGGQLVDGWPDFVDTIVVRAYAIDRSAFSGLEPVSVGARIGLGLVRVRFGDAVLDEVVGDGGVAGLLARLHDSPLDRLVGKDGVVTVRTSAHGTRFFDDVYAVIFGTAAAYRAAVRKKAIDEKLATLVPHALKDADDAELGVLLGLADGRQQGVRFSALVDAVVDANLSATRLLSVARSLAASKANGSSTAAWLALVQDPTCIGPADDGLLDLNPCAFAVTDDNNELVDDIGLFRQALSSFSPERKRALYERQLKDPAVHEQWWYAAPLGLAFVGDFARDDDDFKALVTRWQEVLEKAQAHCQSWGATPRFRFTDPFWCLVLGGGPSLAARLFALAPEDDDRLREAAVRCLELQAQRGGMEVEGVEHVLAWSLGQWVSPVGDIAKRCTPASRARIAALALAHKGLDATRLGAVLGSALRPDHLNPKKKKAAHDTILGALCADLQALKSSSTPFDWVPGFVTANELKLTKDEREMLVRELGPVADVVWPTL